MHAHVWKIKRRGASACTGWWWVDLMLMHAHSHGCACELREVKHWSRKLAPGRRTLENGVTRVPSPAPRATRGKRGKIRVGGRAAGARKTASIAWFGSPPTSLAGWLATTVGSSATGQRRSREPFAAKQTCRIHWCPCETCWMMSLNFWGSVFGTGEYTDGMYPYEWI